MAAPFFCYCGSKFLLFLKTVPRADFKPSIFQNRQLENIYFFQKSFRGHQLVSDASKLLSPWELFEKSVNQLWIVFRQTCEIVRAEKWAWVFHFFMTLVVRLLKLNLGDLSLKKLFKCKARAREKHYNNELQFSLNDLSYVCEFLALFISETSVNLLCNN